MASKDPSPLKDLITANHILHFHRIVDAYGHISIRNPSNPHTFFLSHSIAPALVSAPTDIVEYNIEDASPVKSVRVLDYFLLEHNLLASSQCVVDNL